MLIVILKVKKLLEHFTKKNKLDIDKLRNVFTNLSNLKSKVDKLDVDKFVPVPVDLSKLSNVVKMILLKRLNMMNWLKRLTPRRLLILII